ncbi:MAG: ABC transporter ATP-binding protein [Firmicutes bacterium]|nr:ABC transporter ATP-binding protein [Bacillota bacterium]MDD7601819.1 ABC transporter ATP-binding protein [Bacillota bacterium]MDY5855832.1 ABC transporter ATP-binding protein [Anaerovoracaceae bacterium]
MEAIRTEQLVKQYGKSRGISGVDLTVGEGEFFGFIGPNGAGKSTTIRILLGLIEKTSGNVRVLGEDPSEAGPRRKILSRVGYLPSEAMFYHGMKVKEVLRLSADLRGADCRSEAKMLCERLSLDTEKKVEELSFGNRKKVAIVCALQHKPKLLILDEPTSGLDPLMQREFFRILEERNQAGATVFLSSHVLSEIQNHCSRAAIIREGRIIACGSVEELANTSAKRVSLRGRADLTGLSGIRDLQQAEDAVSFLYSGQMKRLMEVLAAGDITDLTIAEPDLEEIFLHYYEGGVQG